MTGSPNEGLSGCQVNVPSASAKSGLTGTGSRVGVGSGVGVAVGGGGAATGGIGVGEGEEGVAVGDGSTVGVGVGVSEGGSAATAGTGAGMEVGGTGRIGAGPPPPRAATGPDGPNGSDSRKPVMVATPQLMRLSAATIKSSIPQGDLAKDGKGMPREVEGPCVGGWGCVRDAGDGGGGRDAGDGGGGRRGVGGALPLEGEALSPVAPRMSSGSGPD